MTASKRILSIIPTNNGLQKYSGNENFVFVHSSNFERITGRLASEFRKHPWKGRIVVLNYNGNKVYRIMRGALFGMSMNQNECHIGAATISQLGIQHDTNQNVQVDVARCNQQVGRFIYYWNHLDDTTRLAAKIGYVGLFFALVAIGLAIGQYFWHA